MSSPFQQLTGLGVWRSTWSTYAIDYGMHGLQYCTLSFHNLWFRFIADIVRMFVVIININVIIVIAFCRTSYDEL